MHTKSIIVDMKPCLASGKLNLYRNNVNCQNIMSRVVSKTSIWVLCLSKLEFTCSKNSLKSFCCFFVKFLRISHIVLVFLSLSWTSKRQLGYWCFEFLDIALLWLCPLCLLYPEKSTKKTLASQSWKLYNATFWHEPNK